MKHALSVVTIAIAGLAALSAPAAALSVPLLPPAVSWPADGAPAGRGCADPSTIADGPCAPRR